MSYKEDDFLITFPTRHGTPAGSAVERKMLDNAFGSKGIVNRYRENPDGSTTVLRTRAGNPEFTTDDSGAKKTCWAYKAVSNHGFVDTTFNFNGIGDSSEGKLRFLMDSNGVSTPDSKLNIKDSHLWKNKFAIGEVNTSWGLPTNFSGLMRKVAQQFYGGTLKKSYPYESKECATPSVPDTMCHKFSMTHGLFVSSSGKRWVIEISSDGIFRVPISFLREFSGSDIAAEETAVWSANDFESAQDIIAEFWTIARFKRSEREQIYAPPPCYAEGYSPWYDWCGWAFDYTGHKATIALSRTHPSEPSWWQVALFDVTIVEASGMPVYVTYTKSEEGPLAISVNDGGDNYMAALQGPVGFPSVIQTIGLYSPVNIGHTISAPIFSFYERSGARQVYRLDTYALQTVYETIPPIEYDAVTITPVGDWTTGNFTLGATQVHPTASYEISVVSEGSVSREAKNGTSGGLFGVSGTGLPNQNVDFSGTKTTANFVESGTGVISPNGVALPHVSRMSGSSSEGPYDQGDFLPYIDQVNFYVRASATAYSLETTPNYENVVTHQSTAILSGYDREAISVAISISETNGNRTSSSDFWASGRFCAMTSYPLCERTATGYAFGSADAGPLSSGTTDWCLYAVERPSGRHNPSHITGWYDPSPLIGRIASQMWIQKSFTDGAYASINEASSSYSQETTVTRSLIARVDGKTITIPDYPDAAFHRTYHGDYVFRYWCGASAFDKPAVGKSMFYSTLINGKPKVVGVGQHVKGERSLFGFLGVF